MLFSMLLPRTPRSLQADRNDSYKQALRNAARARYTSELLGSEDLYVRVVWFARMKGGPDVDNILKPILDALDGIVYRTDGQIRQCLATKIELSKPYTLSDRYIPDDLYLGLVDLLGLSHSDILFIEVGQVTSQQAIFGPIDGGVQ